MQRYEVTVNFRDASPNEFAIAPHSKSLRGTLVGLESTLAAVLLQQRPPQAGL
jgi:hypothetical protein